MTSKNKKPDYKDSETEQKEDASKTELAKRIAEQSQKAADAYQHLEDGLAKVLRWFSSFLDKIIFNSKHAKLIALILAILMYVIVNYNSMSSIYTTTLKYSKTIEDVEVTAKYNSDTFELSGLPSSANVTITGDATNVTNASGTSDGVVIADLDGMTEGEHTVKLTADGYGTSVTAVVNPSTAVVTLKKKTTQQFDISYDFINQSKMDEIYSAGTPVFEYTKVNVRGSKETLSSIAFVKALIDVSGQTSDFEQDAKLVAYDAIGNPVNADIVPSTIHVKVPVTSPNKTVPIHVQVSGSVPDGKAIDSITMDQQSVTIYANETVLAGIDSVSVTLDATALTKDSSVIRPIVLPSGVGSASVSQVTMSVTLGEGVTKTLSNVSIKYINNIKNYKATQPDNKTTTSVELFGTQANVDKVTASSVNVYIDMSKAEPGLQTFNLNVEQPSDGLVKYSLKESTYEMNILGETTDANSEGSSVNNG
jgi:YbbR domain-containing protein